MWRRDQGQAPPPAASRLSGAWSVGTRRSSSWRAPRSAQLAGTDGTTDIAGWSRYRTTAADPCRRRFDLNRHGIFHYLLYAHARGVPKSGSLPAGTNAHEPPAMSRVRCRWRSIPTTRAQERLRCRRTARPVLPWCRSGCGTTSSVPRTCRRRRRCMSSDTTSVCGTGGQPPVHAAPSADCPVQCQPELHSALLERDELSVSGDGRR